MKQFLWDRRVVEMPRVIWWLILNLVILNTRPRRSARAYRQIWREQGSPLLNISRRQAAGLRRQLQLQQPDIQVELAMRYGRPGIADGLHRLYQRGVRRILLLPLYPQYSATTTASTFDAVSDVFKTWRWIPELRTINHYHDHAAYIAVLRHRVETFWQRHGRAEKLIFSFHGIPQAYFEAGDPYHCECQKTARLLATALELDERQWMVTFQSRLGPKQWLQPYTDTSLKQLAHDGCQSVQVICPGFSADCLETLEEIALANRKVFMQAGGLEYGYIPCLNDDERHIQMLADLALQHLAGWLERPDRSALQQSKIRAVKMGAPA